MCIARDNRRGIELYTKSGKLYHERAATRDLLRYIKTKVKSREEQIQRIKELKKREPGTKGGGGEGGREREMIFPWLQRCPNILLFVSSGGLYLVQEVGRGGEVTARPYRVPGPVCPGDTFEYVGSQGLR